MFGRRRHRAPVLDAPSAPVTAPGVELSEEVLFEKIRARLDQHLGAAGSWTLVRRNDADTESFFHEMAALSLARELTADIVGSRVGLGADAAPAEPVQRITVQTVTASGPSGVADVDPAAFDLPAAGQVPVTTSAAEHVMFELNTVAVWADPQRHDPAHVDTRMVTPTPSPRRRWNGTRVS